MLSFRSFCFPPRFLGNFRLGFSPSDFPLFNSAFPEGFRIRALFSCRTSFLDTIFRSVPLFSSVGACAKRTPFIFSPYPPKVSPPEEGYLFFFPSIRFSLVWRYFGEANPFFLGLEARFFFFPYQDPSFLFIF